MEVYRTTFSEKMKTDNVKLNTDLLNIYLKFITKKNKTVFLDISSRIL